MFGSYEALNGGLTEEALVDFTGGIGYRIDLTKKDELHSDLFGLLQYLDHMSTLMGCSIYVRLLCVVLLLFCALFSYYLNNRQSSADLGALVLLVGQQEEHPARVMRCRLDYPSGARCE